MHAKFALDVFTMALDRLRAQIQGFSNLSCTKSRTKQLENVDLAVGQIFDAGVVALTLMGILPRCFERFLEGEHGDFPAHINFAVHNLADGREELFVRCVLHQITAGASAQGPLGKKSFLKLGKHEDPQFGVLYLKRLNKFQRVPGAQLQTKQDQVRFASRKDALHRRDGVGVAAGDYVELLFNQVNGALTEKGIIFYIQDSYSCEMP